MRTSRYVLCLSLLTGAALAPMPAAAAPAHQQVVATVPVCFHPIGVAVNPATDRIYVACFGDGTFQAISGRTNKVIASHRLGSSLWAVAVNPSTGLVYVTNQAQRQVLVINGQTNQVTAKIKVPFPPAGIAVNPVNDKIYVGRFRGHDVSVIDGKTNAIIATDRVSFDPL